MTETLVRLPASARAAQLARRHLAGVTDAAHAEFVDDALLIVSELVTNAVTHGCGAFVTIRFSISAECVRVAVHDSGDHLPVTPDGVPDLTSPGGRGLLIVSALATRWGVVLDESPPGKTVWAELDTAPRAD